MILMNTAAPEIHLENVYKVHIYTVKYSLFCELNVRDSSEANWQVLYTLYVVAQFILDSYCISLVFRFVNE